MTRPTYVEERQPVSHDNDNNDGGIQCNKCTHCKVCMYKEKYAEFVSEVIDIRKKYNDSILDFTIKCAEYTYNKQPIPRKM